MVALILVHWMISRFCRKSICQMAFLICEWVLIIHHNFFMLIAMSIDKFLVLTLTMYSQCLRVNLAVIMKSPISHVYRVDTTLGIYNPSLNHFPTVISYQVLSKINGVRRNSNQAHHLTYSPGAEEYPKQTGSTPLILTCWGRDKMSIIFNKTFSN